MGRKVDLRVMLAGILVALLAPGLVLGQDLSVPDSFITADLRFTRSPFPEMTIARAFLAQDSTFTMDLFCLDPVGRALMAPRGHPIPLCVALMNQPLRTPNIAYATASGFVRTETSLHELLAQAADQQGYPLRLTQYTGIDSQIEGAWAERDDLEKAILEFFDGSRRLSGNERDELRRVVPRVRNDVAQMTSFLLGSIHRALGWHAASFREAKLPRDRLDKRNFDRLVCEWADSLGGSTGASAEKAVKQASKGVDFNNLNTGAILLARAMDDVIGHLDLQPDQFADSTSAAELLFSWDTPDGRIEIGGTGPNHYRGPHLLIVDLGGDDQYVDVGAAVFPSHPISLVLDREGNDSYVSVDTLDPGVGGAVGGWSLVADLAGDDTWRTRSIGLGASLFGAGLLLDRSGNDSYESYTFGQGASAFGLGVLVDIQGNDAFKVARAGQGFGGPVGIGILLDNSGNDHFEAIRLAQGCGYGTGPASGADDGYAGGLGILSDFDGDDQYLLHEAGQGYGVRGGAGFLVESSGDDSFIGEWWAQGSADAGGLGMIMDVSGNDTYQAYSLAQGFARSISAAICVDLEGNDSYRTIMGLGEAEDGGFGMAADLSGDDEYSPNGGTGCVTVDTNSPLLQMTWSTGLFIDLHGVDRYPGESRTSGTRANKTTWGGHDDPDPTPGLTRWRRIGIGIDLE